MATRKERADDLARRRALAAKYPACRYCRKPVVAGQTDSQGNPVHHTCALAFLLIDRPHKRFIPPNPKLPQVMHGHFWRPPKPQTEGTLSTSGRNPTA